MLPATADVGRPQAVSGYPLADDLFFVALDDRTGQLRVHADVVGPALAGALLAELMVGKWIEVSDEFVEPSAEALHRRTVPLDALAHKVLDTVLGQRELLTVRQWIAFLAGSAEQEVADRLARANKIAVTQRRRGLSKATVYTPADANTAAWPRSRLSDHWRARRPIADHDIVLTGLCHAAGLLHNILDAAGSATYTDAMQHVDDRLATAASVQTLIGALEDAVTANASTLA